ncbi:small multi-drug export protein [Candidatus Uhrbacteria bacterium]|nr:small multi-drug export protein [Candidatus Uhrbacteria bacterium]
MTEALIAAVESFPHWLATVVLSALPLTEHRLSIPIAIHSWNMAPLEAYGWAVLGALLPFFPLYYGLMALRGLCERHAPWLVGPIDRALARSEKKVRQSYEKYGAIALCLFVAIPLPLTGLWTATLAAVAMKLPLKSSFVAIALGTLIAGGIVTFVSAGAEAWF